MGDSIMLAVVALGSVDSVPVGELRGSCSGCRVQQHAVGIQVCVCTGEANAAIA
jgi:hypothetical protein